MRFCLIGRTAGLTRTELGRGWPNSVSFPFRTAASAQVPPASYMQFGAAETLKHSILGKLAAITRSPKRVTGAAGPCKTA